MTTEHPTIAAALVALQNEIPVVGKSKTATVPTKAGGSYSYRYSDLTSVMQAAIPVLIRHGLSYTCRPRLVEGTRAYELVGVLLHTSGESIEGALPLYGNSAQEIGGAITYARRYLLGCLTGLVTDDDDDSVGQRLSGPSATEPHREPTEGENFRAALDALPPTVQETVRENWPYPGVLPEDLTEEQRENVRGLVQMARTANMETPA